jgi:Glyoxalase-like domain
MANRISCICIDTVDPAPLEEFWMAVLGYEVREADDEGVSLGPPGGGLPTVDIMHVPEPKTVKNRLHLDLRADGTTTGAELERLLALGARPVDIGQGPDVDWVVLADPEGNEFCLLRRTVQEVLR